MLHVTYKVLIQPAYCLLPAFPVKLGDLDEALDNFQRALELAKTQSDKAAESAIRRAIDDVNNTIDKQTRQGERKEGQSRGQLFSHLAPVAPALG